MRPVLHTSIVVVNRVADFGELVEAVFVTEIVGRHTTSNVCVANAPASSGGVNCGYDKAMSTRSRITVLHSAGSSGMVTVTVEVHTVAGANVPPAVTTVESGNEQLIVTGGPFPGLPAVMNGNVSVRAVTVRDLGPHRRPTHRW